ncbi:MAG: hypothetical protein J6X12_03525 [Paludibacteraceae bacterium]|nr:hypothetical protein [Paludibacteraceae bacterium]
MKHWLFIISAAMLSSGLFSCSDDPEDYSDDLAEIKKMQGDLSAKLDSLSKAQKELDKKQENLNKKQEDLNKKQEELNKMVDDPEGEEEGEEGEEPDTSTVFKKYEKPGWKSVEYSGDFAYSMTVVYQLPSDMKANATSNDLFAAFVGDECRAVGKSINGVFLLTVIGTGNESEPVVFRYWNANTQYMYESLDKIQFTPDLIYGVVDEPKTFKCKHL